MLDRLEKGDFKLRVRALEVERHMERSQLLQSTTFDAVLAALFLNAGLCLFQLGTGLPSQLPLRLVMFGASCFYGIKVPFGVFQLNNLDKYNERYGVKK